MMNISSSSTTSCFDFALNDLDKIPETIVAECHSSIWELKVGISLLKTFDLYIGKCSKRRRSNQPGDSKSDSLSHGSISFRIKDLVQRSFDRDDSAVFRCIQYGEPNPSGIRSEIDVFRGNAGRLVTDIKELDIVSLSDYYSLGDLQLVMDFVDSILVSLAFLCVGMFRLGTGVDVALQILQDKLMVLKSFVSFARVQGVEGQPLIKLLDHVEDVAVNVANLTSTYWFQRQVWNIIGFKICQPIQKMIDPVDPQVREIFTHVLEASKSSRSSFTVALKENRHLVAKLIVYFLPSMTGIISECYTSFPVTVKDQMLQLLEGVRFLSVLLSLQQEKFDELNDEIKDRIGAVVFDVGIMAFSHSVNEMKEDLCRYLKLLQVLKSIIAEAAHVCPLTLSSSSFCFPRTNELGSLDFLLANLKELVSSTADSTTFPNHQIPTIQKDLESLRSFLEKIVEQRNRDEKLQVLWSRVMKVAYSAELEIDRALLGDKRKLCLDAIAGDIKHLKIEAQKIFDGKTQGVTKTTVNMPPQVTSPIYNEAPVGLEDEVKSIIDKLVKGSKKLDIVGIVGMPGLGKTTLANTVYGDPLIRSHFHICAWCCFSQTYTKHSLLFQILCSINATSSVKYLQGDENNMAEELRQKLLKQRYLIIFDDVWDNGGWNLLKQSLPDDRNRSRILVTSRFHNLSFIDELDSKPHHLRPLTVDESFKLLQKKLFAEDCPPTLSEVLLSVAKSCNGLPLAILLAAGILATKKQECWKEAARHLTSSIFVDDKNCKKTLEQSYNYLPDYLKPCLLYFGAFKDQHIPIRNMLWLWISEGFVQKIEGKSLEDIADNYLKELIRRSLVIDAQQKFLGGTKTFRIHDLVYEFCVVKAKEESFLQSLHADDLLTLTGPAYPHRLSIHSTKTMKLTIRFLFPNLRCLFLFGNRAGQLDQNSVKFMLSKFLRVLDLWNSSFQASYFPSEVTFLIHLRYLRIGKFDGDIPSAIANLSRLETFVVGDGRSYLLPNTIWNIKTLRHLVTYGQWGLRSQGGFRFPIDNLEGSPDLEHLDTLSLAMDSPSQHLQKILSKLPNIRKLTIEPEGARTSAYARIDKILALTHLSRLESLKIRMCRGYEFEFPSNLKSLTLSHNYQPWSKISAIGKLPDLVVLKLCFNSFVGELWEMEEGEFSNLRFLKLSDLNIRLWTASSDNFSCLEKLVLDNCTELKKVPSCLGESLALNMIEVKRRWQCVDSMKQIWQDQKDSGNEDLRINVNNS